MNLIERALQIAVKAHQGQLRKNDDIPYIVHPVMVSRIVERYGFSEVVVAAALVHDVLEDTNTGESYLRQELGNEVTDIVVSVSENKSLPWEERKKKYIDMVTAAPESVKAVSVADKIHNARDFIYSHKKEGPSVWSRYRRGREQSIWFQRTLCDSLKSVWIHPMLDEFESLVKVLEGLP